MSIPSSTAGGSDWATKEITRGLEGNNFSIPTPTTSTLLPSEVDHKVVSGASQIKDEHRIQEDKLDSKLKEFIRDNQEIATKVEEIGYGKFKQQLIAAAKVASQKQNETKADSLKDKVSFGIKELFGIQEAEAGPAVAVGLGAEAVAGTTFYEALLIAASGTVLGTAVIDAKAVVDDTKVALYNQLFQIMGDKFLEIVLSAGEKNDYNTLSEFEKRKHDDNSNKPSTSKQQQKVSAASFMPSDPNDNDPDDEFSHFKKKDGSNRYECEKQESPEWKKSQNFKDEFRTNGDTGKNKEYYRWDMKHKDIEIYDHDAYHIGSKDPVTGKIYRQGTMIRNEKLRSIIK